MKIYLKSIFFICTILFCVSCGHERVGCNGDILVEHPIPDTTIYLNGEPYRRDIFESPVVFKHTGDIPFSITVTSNDHGMIVEANNKINKDTGKASIVEVIPKKEGNTAVNILVDDGCGGLEYSFNVSVQDTSK